MIKKNKPTNRIIVNGYQKYYSIENIILDPFLLVLYIVQAHNEKNDLFENNNSNTKLKHILNENITVDSIIKLNKQTLSEFAKVITEKIFDNNPIKVITYNYGSDIEVDIDERAASMKGHDYEIKIKDSFAYLKKLDLKKEIIDNIILPHPKLIPKAIIDSFNAIINKDAH